MPPRPFIFGQPRAHQTTRLRRLFEKFALALAAALLLSIFLFVLVHLNEAVRDWGAHN